MVYLWYDIDEEHRALEKNRCVGEGMELNVRLWQKMLLPY